MNTLLNKLDTLQNNEGPHGSWHMTGTNSIDWDGKRYLLIVNYVSKYFSLFQIYSTTISAVISWLTVLFPQMEQPSKSTLIMDELLAQKNRTTS